MGTNVMDISEKRMIYEEEFPTFLAIEDAFNLITRAEIDTEEIYEGTPALTSMGPLFLRSMRLARILFTQTRAARTALAVSGYPCDRLPDDWFVK